MSSKSDRVIDMLKKVGNGGLHIEQIAGQLSQQEGKTVTEKQARGAIDRARAYDSAPIHNLASNTFAYLPERGPWIMKHKNTRKKMWRE